MLLLPACVLEVHCLYDVVTHIPRHRLPARNSCNARGERVAMVMGDYVRCFFAGIEFSGAHCAAVVIDSCC